MTNTFLCENKYSNDPGAGGRTLERMLGVAPNNSKTPDLDNEHELKTHKAGSPWPTTLFSLEPKFSDEFSDRSGLKKRGPIPQMARITGQRLSYPLVCYQSQDMQNEGFQKLCKNSTRKGFSLLVYEAENVLRLTWDRSVAAINEPLWAASISHVLDGLTLEWNLDQLNKQALKKLNSLKLVKYESSDNYIRYDEFHQEMKGLKRFSDCIRNGSVIVEINCGFFPNGKPKNHGCKFRCDENNLKTLYEQAPTISSTKDLMIAYGPNYSLAV